MKQPDQKSIFERLSYLESQIKELQKEKKTLLKENEQLQALLKKLRESESRLEYFAAQAQDLMWTTDLDMNVTFINKYSKSLLGWKPQELMQLGVDQMFPFDTLTKVLPYYRQKLKEVKMGNKLTSPISLEVELLHKNGQHVWAEMRADFVYDKNDKAVGVIGISRNIEARKKAEIKLKEQEELYRLLLLNTSDTVYLTDEQGGFQFVGKGKDVIFETTHEDIIARQNINRLFEQDLIREFENSGSSELRNIRKDILTVSDKRKKLLVNIKKVNIKSGKLLFSCRDITDLEETRRALNMKELEFEELEKKKNRQKQVMEKAEDLAKWGSWQWNIKDNSFVLSRGWRKIHGYYKEDVSFEDIEKIIHPDDLPKLKQEINNAIETHGYGEVEVRVLIPGTSNVKYIRSTGKVFLDEKNKPEKMIGYVRDLSEYRHTEKYLRDNISKYRKIIDDAPVGIALLKQGSFAYANNATAEIYDCGNISSLLKKNITDFVHKEDREHVRHKISQFVPDKAPFDISHRISTAANKSKKLQVILSSLKIEGENYLHAVINEQSLNQQNEADASMAAEPLYQYGKTAFLEEISGITALLSDKYHFDENDRQKIQDIIKRYDDRESHRQILQNHFEKQHREFMARLLEKHPHLTQHELRHCGCILMNLSTREVAGLFNVQPSSIQKSRVRLKKRLELDPDEDLRTYLHNF